jgi:hypothetical protein
MCSSVTATRGSNHIQRVDTVPIIKCTLSVLIIHLFFDGMAAWATGDAGALCGVSEFTARILCVATKNVGRFRVEAFREKDFAANNVHCRASQCVSRTY